MEYGSELKTPELGLRYVIFLQCHETTCIKYLQLKTNKYSVVLVLGIELTHKAGNVQGLVRERVHPAGVTYTDRNIIVQSGHPQSADPMSGRLARNKAWP